MTTTSPDLQWRVPRRSTPYLQGATGPSRLVGLDAARGLAILGMLVAHMGVTTYGFTSLEGWLGLSHGRSSILFATIAGFSLGIITGRTRPHTGVKLVRSRLRILVRSVMLLVIAGALALLETSVALILGYYAAWFVLALPFLGWGARRLLVLGGAVLTLGSIAYMYWPNIFNLLGLNPYFTTVDANGAAIEFLLTGMYPGIVWMAFIFVGLGLARMDWSSTARMARLAGVGAALLLVGYVGGHYLYNAFSETDLEWELVSPQMDETADDMWSSSALPPSWLPSDDPAVLDSGNSTWTDGSWTDDSWSSGDWTEEPWLSEPPEPQPIENIFQSYPHSGTLFEGIGSLGLALLVMGVLFLIGRAAPLVLAPLAAVGSMSLTAYSLHVVAIRALNDLAPDASDTNWAVFWVALGIVAFAMLWKLFFARGPLEHLVHVVSLRATHTREDSPVSAPVPVTVPAPASATLPPWQPPRSPVP